MDTSPMAGLESPKDNKLNSGDRHAEFSPFGCRFDPMCNTGHYESYFLRANHPTQAKAIWIRYTIFSAKGNANPSGELWAIVFDSNNQKTTVYQELPFSECQFDNDKLNVKVGDAMLAETMAKGVAKDDKNKLSWNLSISHVNSPACDPLLLLPEHFYQRKLPKAKALVGIPHATFNGQLQLGDDSIDIDNWKGSINHNWGSQHTDRYAWGQVIGFDNYHDATLECATAQIKLGPILSPPVTLLVLRIEGEEYPLNTLFQGLKASGLYEKEGNDFIWVLASKNKAFSISGKIWAPTCRFTRLSYRNPPGGHLYCYNSKIAACEITLQRKGKPDLTLRTEHRAAFEILTPHVYDI